jgi:long-chain fatty acid transport protein
MEERFGFSTRLKGMGGVGIAEASDFSATYYNPANLSFCPQTRISVEYDYMNTKFKLSRHQRSRPEQLGSYHGVGLGICLKLPFKFALGAYGLFGPSEPVTLQFRTLDAIPRMTLYERDLSSPSAGLGLSFQPVSWLAIGIATSLTFYSDFKQTIRLPLAPKELELDMTGSVRPTLPIVVGLTILPLEQLKIALVFRQARYNKLEDISETHLNLGTLNFDVKQNIEASFGFSPMQLGGGASYKFQDFLVATELTWLRWAEYRGPFLRVKPADEMSRLIAYPPNEKFKFRNIFVPRLGFEYTWNDLLSARAGYAYRMNAAFTAPEGVAQLIDSDTHMLSLGGGYKFSWEKVIINTDLFFNAHLIAQRRLADYTLYGWAYNTGIGLTIEY